MTETTYTAPQILAIGGKEWRKDSLHRVYLDKDLVATLIGLKLTWYGTGRLSGATLDGDVISNARGADIWAAIDKVWWDSADSKIHTRLRPTRGTESLGEWIRDGIAERIAANAS